MSTTHRMYGGDVELVFDEKKHRYTCNGVAVPSVTTIVGILDKSGPLVGWSLKVAAEYVGSTLRNKLWPGSGVAASLTEDDIALLCEQMKREPRKKTKWAASIGTQAHEWIERHIKAQLKFDSMPEMPENERVLNCVNAFLKWEKDNIVEYVASEARIYSRAHRYAGTLDVLASINRNLMVLDLKTSSGIYPEYILQTAAYQNAYEEEHTIKIEGRIILRIDKETAEFSELKLDDCKADGSIEAFLGLRHAYEWINNQSPV